MAEASGVLFAIKKFAIHDGPGIRTTLFFQGCPMDCWWCHNPEGQHRLPAPPVPGVSQGRLTGRRATVSELLAEIEKDRLFYDDSGGGVTFSGGEPLLQPDFLEALLRECRARSIHTVLDTSGYGPTAVVERLMDWVDLVHFDLKLIDDARHRYFTGVSVKPVLQNLKILAAAERPIVIRFPLVPGMTDDSENLSGICRITESLPHPVLRIDVLPFHHLHGVKCERLGRKDRMEGIASPGEDRVRVAAAFFRSRGYPVNVGG